MPIRGSTLKHIRLHVWKIIYVVISYEEKNEYITEEEEDEEGEEEEEEREERERQTDRQTDR